MLILPKLEKLRQTLPIEGAVRIELVENIPIFRASTTLKNRIEELLEKQQISPLSPDEEQELNLYEEIDDYLSFVNRTVRNLLTVNSQQSTVKEVNILKNITIWGTLAAISLLLTAGFLLPTKASNSPLQQIAQQPNCKTPQTTADMNMCSSQEFQAADRKLNQVYQQLQPKLKSKQQQRLTAAQRSWLKFRDESCDYEMGQFEGGTLAAPTYGYCRARVTQERIKDLEGYLKQASL